MNPYRYQCPVMLASKSAYRLALRIAKRGGRVAVVAADPVLLAQARADLLTLLKRRHPISYFLFPSWNVRPHEIAHQSRGRILLGRVGSIWVGVSGVDLEVRM